MERIQMKKRAVIFDIENNQNEYADCLHIMNVIEKKQAPDDISELQNKVRITFCEEEWLIKDIMECASEPLPENLSEIKADASLIYFFHVDCTGETDLINLIYYCLLHDKLSQEGHDCILCVKCSMKQRFNISDFLTWVLYTGTVKNCYVHIDKTYWPIKKERITNLNYEHKKINSQRHSGVRIMKQFSPIFRIDKDADEESCESVTYWRQPMRTFLEKLYKGMQAKKEKIPVARDDKQKKEFENNYFLPHVRPTSLYIHKKGSKQYEYNGEMWQGKCYANEKHLMSNFVECFCTVNGEIPDGFEGGMTDLSKKMFAEWKSKELYDKIKEMPLLAMYIFCLSEYFGRDKEIDQKIYDARDMADGLLQILENIYHSEKGKGYFCFRVHTDCEGRSKQYLRKEYNTYMKEWEKVEKEPRDYLEIKIVDFSHISIPQRFYLNFKKRMEEAPDEEKNIYENIKGKAAELKVSSFFGDSLDFWDEYNKIPENIVHHYGLQIFESLVSCCGGCFRVRSQSMEKLNQQIELYATHKMEDISDKAIPGTQYEILIPFRKPIQLQDLSLDININYTEGLLKGYNDNICKDIDLVGKFCDVVLNEIREDYPAASYQERKEMAVQALADYLNNKAKKKQPADKRILHFFAQKIPLSRIELFCKAVMLNIVNKPQEQNFYTMITECTASHFVEITRMFALFYNKQGINSYMKNVQIFMSGQKEGEEFLITGANLGEAIGSTEKLAFARCTHPDCLKIMKKMLKNHKMGVHPNDIVNIVPFDMIQYDDSKQTLLERRLIDVLNENVLSSQFGCKLERLHVRIGSKIHIQTFYEAELLFHNNYYTSRFAYWLYNELCSNNELDLHKPFVLVGCENYSEMMLNELCNMFEKKDIETEYLIYEERITGKFRGKKTIDSYKDYQFIIVVPINSTLTTHIKISGFLKKAIQDALEERGVSDYDKYALGKVLNYGIVLIGTEKENKYWGKSEDRKNVIDSKIDNSTMKYYVEVASEWMDPLRCEYCFPDDDFKKELPLVETNKESIVPMHAIGIRKTELKGTERIWEEDEYIQDLSKFLVYKHIERNGNHFNYYFATERLWDFPEIRDKIRIWLESKKNKLFKTGQCKIYDIIVAPLHYSNTVFVEEVNACLFKNAALVLHFDADKEFRMNVRTKYSSVQQLYDNLCESDEKSIINFHYIDDTIVSGRTFRRMKSLVTSLIHEKRKQAVRINIFKSIVLLLNRMSLSSQKDYIDNPRYYLSYFNLQISSMRVNSDACVLCKKYNEWNKLAQQSSLNNAFRYWQKKSEGLKCVPIEEFDSKRDVEDSKIKRSGQYMIASHRAKKLLDVACDYMDEKDISNIIIEKLFPDDISDSLDELIAMLKVLGRPFLSFRKEEREAVFGLLLLMLDTLLEEKKPLGEEKLDKLLRNIWLNNSHRILIVKILLNRLAELESNYIIRKRSIDKILLFCSNHIVDRKEQQEFIDNYLNRVKQLVGQSNDFAKGLYLEYLLLYNEEYPKEGRNENRDIVSLIRSGANISFKKSAYLENTKLVNYGIEYLAESFLGQKEITEDSLKATLNENYYFDNFIKYLSFHKAIETDENDKVLNFTSDAKRKEIEGMIRFELLYQRIFGQSNLGKAQENSVEKGEIGKEDIKDKYMEMLEYLKDASGALDGEIIVPYGEMEGDKKYIALELGTSTELRRLENNERVIKSFMDQNLTFEKDTYAICNGVGARFDQQKWLLLKFFESAEADNDGISVIYLLFPFKTQNEDKILHSLKNILVFRHKIWKILNLSSSTLLKNWTDNLFYKQQVLKSRAVKHSEVEDLDIELKKFVVSILEEYQEANEQQKKLYGDYFELLVNSMIGAMNVKVLGNKGRDYAETAKKTFKEYWLTLRYVNNALAKIWHLDINIEDQALEKYYIRFRTGTKEEQPAFLILNIIFLAVFQNIKKHGCQDEKQRCKVSVFVKGGVLWITNSINEAERIEIARMLKLDGYRNGEGISQAVIYDLCKSWYQDVKYSDMFGIYPEESNGNKWMYVVKLPIIERRDENE